MTYQSRSLLAVFLFADDRFLLEKVQSPSDCASNHDLTSKLISDWAKRWLVTMNESKTWQKETSLYFTPPLVLNNSIIEDVTVYEHLSLTLSSNLSWRAHTVEPLLTDTSLIRTPL